MQHFKITILLLLVCSSVFANEMFKELEFYTEIYPPYNFQTSDKKPAGISVDVLNQALGSLSFKPKYKFLPWNRGYKISQMKGRKIVLFSTTRTKERESLYKWVGPITETTIKVFGKAEDKNKINSKEELKKYTYAVIRGDVGELLLKSAGVPDKNITKMSNFNQVLKHLFSGKSDFISYEYQVAMWFAAAEGHTSSEFAPVYTLKRGHLYYAVNPSVSDDVVKKMQTAVEKIVKNSKTFEKILKKYNR